MRGYFPEHEEIKKIDNSLYCLIADRRLMKKFRLLITGDKWRKPNKKWNEENIIKNLEEIIKQLGRFPKQSDLKKINKNGLAGAIAKNGGYHKFREEMGFEKLMNVQGYWTEEKIIEELKQEIDKNNGNFPKKKINKNLFYRMSGSRGVNYYRKLLGFPIIQNDRFYWQNFEVVKNAIKEKFPELIEKQIFPTLQMIRSKIPGLADGIRFHGGVKKVANLMNCKNRLFISSDGHYLESGLELIFDEFLFENNIAHEVHGFICEGKPYRYDFKIGDVYIEIWGYHKNSLKKRLVEYNKKRDKKEELYGSLELKLVSIENFAGKPEDQIKEYFKECLGKFNIESIAVSNNNAIVNNVKPPNYWDDKKAIEEIKIIIKETGEFPIRSFLRKNNKSLDSAITRLGGLLKFRKILGYPLPISKKLIWTKELVLKTLKELAETLGHYPKRREMPMKVFAGAARYGGILALKKELGYN